MLSRNIFVVEAAIVITILFHFTVTQFLSWRKRKRLMKQWECKPSMAEIAYGPWGIPFMIKSLWALTTRNILEVIEDFFPPFGMKTIQTTVMGVTAIHTIDPINVKAVLSTQFNDFQLGMRREYIHPFLGNGIFSLDGAGWRHSRSVLRPQFKKSQMTDLTMAENHVQLMVSRFPADGESFDIQEKFFCLTFDTTTEFLLGVSAFSQLQTEDGEGRLFLKHFDKGQVHISKRAKLQPFYFFYNTLEMYQDFTAVHRYVDKHVYNALESQKSRNEGTCRNNEKYVFLNELVKEMQDPIAVRSQILNILLAGRATTAGTLSWTFYCLARHPQVYEKLRESILQIYGDGRDPTELADRISFETLRRCDYLQWVIKEVLRLFPTIPVNFRYASGDTTLPRGGGTDGQSKLFVPKGSMVSFIGFVIHRDKRYWGEDALEFIPERWQLQRESNWQYFPFNGGPRICLGKQYSLTMMSYVIVRILQMFERIDTDFKELQPALSNTVALFHQKGVQIKLYRAS